MKYLSVCSGIEAATCAWHPLGWAPVGFSEIEKFPSAVLNYHYPHVANLGNMENYKEWNIERPDILVGGTPCQSFSVAGLRKGMDDPRGNLALVYLGIADHYKPLWVVWENVPGVLSSYSGPEPPSDLEEGQEWEAEETSDFECFTTALAKIGYGWAYRVLDAQYFGVPQRRRRVFVVGYLGDWRRAAAVLFERNSLLGNSPPSREEREEVASTVGDSFTASSYGCYNHEAPIVLSTANTNANGSNINTDNVSYTLDGANSNAVAFEPGIAKREGGVSRFSVDVSPTLRSEMGDNQPAVAKDMQVRRLTPVECERLQGLPDNYTQIPWRNKPPEQCPNGPRYKALGNSMAVPVMRWIGERIINLHQ